MGKNTGIFTGMQAWGLFCGVWGQTKAGAEDQPRPLISSSYKSCVHDPVDKTTKAEHKAKTSALQLTSHVIIIH